jgi:hypothetical protein
MKTVNLSTPFNKKSIALLTVSLKAKKEEIFWISSLVFESGMNYIMPPIPPPPIGGIAGESSFTSATTHSVINNNAAIDAAFSKAKRVTLVGSITPA